VSTIKYSDFQQIFISLGRSLFTLTLILKSFVINLLKCLSKWNSTSNDATVFFY